MMSRASHGCIGWAVTVACGSGSHLIKVVVGPGASGDESVFSKSVFQRWLRMLSDTCLRENRDYHKSFQLGSGVKFKVSAQRTLDWMAKEVDGGQLRRDDLKDDFNFDRKINSTKFQLRFPRQHGGQDAQFEEVKDWMIRI